MNKLCITLLMLFICSCNVTKPNFYQISNTENINIIDSKNKKIIYIKPVILAKEVSRPQIITLGNNNNQLNVAENHRWISSLNNLIQNSINQNMSKMLPNAYIENTSGLDKNYNYIVEISINSLIGKLDNQVDLVSTYKIKNNQNKILYRGKYITNCTTESTYSSYVTAINEVVYKLSTDITNHIVLLSK